MRNHSNNDFLSLLGGLAMLIAGLYWLLSSVTVTTGFYGLRIGAFSVSSGLTVVPFIVGIVMLFFNFSSKLARFVTACGVLVIIAAIVMSTRFYFRHTSLYAYLLMLVFIGGGAALVAKALWGGKKS